jgi:mono/diheme cytochrome c family protein
MGVLKGGMKRLAQVVLLCLAGGCSALTGTQPADTPLARGQAVFEKHCQVCHGARGKGDCYPFLKPPPADLTAAEVQSKPDVQLLNTIREGHAETAMGAWRVSLSDGESWDVLAYVRTLQK